MDQRVATNTGRPIGLLAPAAPDGATATRRRRIWRTLTWRRLLLVVAGIGLASFAAVWGRDYWLNGRFLESTDDAYLAADAVTVAPHVAGYVSEVLVTDNEPVVAGQTLARIDDRDFRTALDRAKAMLRSAEADIQNLDAQLVRQTSVVTQDEADVQSAKAAAVLAEQDLQRAQDLLRTGAGTVKAAQQSEADIQEKHARIAHAQGALSAARQQIDVLRAQRSIAEARKQSDRATLEQAELNLSYTKITASVAGAVGDRSLRVGRYVQPGAPLMQIVPLGREIYIVANFKETQLAQMFRGEHVDVTIDMFPGHDFDGRVDSLAPGSGSQFALLPPENATGNFTKIVQRVPVKIRFGRDDDPLLHQLRPGLSVEVTVDTRTKGNGAPSTLALPVAASSPRQARQ